MSVIATYLETAGPIGVWGIGLEGQSTLRYLAKLGLLDRVQAFDQNPEKAQTALAEAGIEGIEVHTQDLLEKRAMELGLLVVAPGIPVRKFPFVQGTQLENQASLLVREHWHKVVGVTGTKGKSTFCSLLHQSSLACGAQSLLVGNIGRPPLDVADQLNEADWVVAEFSSYQLDLVRHSPGTSFVLNLFEDHLDYHGNRTAYWGAKFNIFRYPCGPSTCHYAEGFPALQKAVDDEAEGEMVFAPFQTDGFWEPVPEPIRRAVLDNPALRPEHLRGMINALWTFHQARNPQVDAIAKTLADFEPLKYRLQDEGLHGGVRFVNDSISTVPECSLAALRAFSVCDCLIMGGMDRGVNLKPVAETLASWSGHLILLPDSGNRLKQEIEALGDLALLSLTLVETLEETIERALAIRPKCCVFSPGAPSYNRFTNFVDRGSAFSRLIRELA